MAAMSAVPTAASGFTPPSSSHGSGSSNVNGNGYAWNGSYSTAENDEVSGDDHEARHVPSSCRVYIRSSYIPAPLLEPPFPLWLLRETCMLACHCSCHHPAPSEPVVTCGCRREGFMEFINGT